VKCIPNQYASYDAMGNMTCRNTDTTTGHTCGSSPTGALMSYDNEGRLASWTAPSGTTASDGFLYDNEGNRVLQRVNNGTVTDTITFDGYSETVLSGGTITPTKYYNVNGQRVAMRTNSTLSYLLSDVLGSSTIALDSTGTTQAVQLFAPYGAIRYSQGTMPTTYNFTGQRLDSQTGLLYYNFRYYDPVSGRFVRADTTQTNAGGMDPYAYVGNNPEGRTDPTGHCWPWCTALIGAAVGAVIGVAVTTVTSYATTGKPPSGGELLQAAVSGAVSGAIVGVLGPGAGVVEAVGIGALSGAVSGVAGKLAYNAVTRTSLSDGLLQAGVEGAVIGGLTGGVFKAAAPLGKVLSSGLRDEEGVLGGLWQRAQQIRANAVTPTGEVGGGPIGLGRNIAFADYNIGGDTGTLNGVSGQAFRRGAVNQLTTRFNIIDPESAFDAEAKIFAYLADQYANDTSVSGTIDLFSEREPCETCASVIDQFREMFGGRITVNVRWYIPRGIQWP
jgi:RHS repeat-associated protein